MYADNPRSRIIREFFYILNAMKDHYKALLRMKEDEPVRLGSILILMATYMLKEEGKKYIRPLDIVYETQMPRSSVYKILHDLADEEILQDHLGEFICLSHTPNFLLNPTELYGKELAVVRDKDYEKEEKIMQSMEIMVQKAVAAELDKRRLQPMPRPPPPGIGIGMGEMEDMKRESISESLPLYPIGITTPPPLIKIKKKKKTTDKNEEEIEDIPMDEENEVEKDLGDFFL